MPYELRVEGSN